MPYPQFSNKSGVPLGGIGAGKVEFCADGAFRNLTCFNNLDLPIAGDEHAGIVGAFFAVHVAGAGAIALKQHEAEVRTLPAGAIEFTGSFPFASARYPDWGGVSLGLEAFSSLLLDDRNEGHKDSCLPVAEFRLNAKNEADAPKYVSFAISFPNLLGQGGYPGVVLRDERHNYVQYRKLRDGHTLELRHRSPKIDARLNGELSVNLLGQPALDVSHRLWGKWAFDLGKPSRVWSEFDARGRFDSLVASEAPHVTAGMLTAGKTVAPGETLTVSFLLAWYFPDRVAHEHPDVIYKNRYARWFTSSLDAARYFQERRDRLYEGTRSWQSRIRSSSLPEWLADRLINGAFPLVTNSLYTVDGRFSSAEAPTQMAGCMGTIDQRAAASSVYAMAFPELDRSELELFQKQQIDELHPQRLGPHWDTRQGTFGKQLDRAGAIRHDTGWDHIEGGRLGSSGWLSLHWPDLSSVYVLQCFQHYEWTGDESFWKDAYPSMKAALRFQARLDQDEDGIADLWGPGSSTYDNESFPYYGASPFIGTLYLAALRVMQRAAARQGDESYLAELTQRFARAQSTIEQRLWDSELGYYVLWRDSGHTAWAATERAHAERSDWCMIAQLAGQWYAGLFGLGTLLDPQRMRSALAAIKRLNVDSVSGAPANEASPSGDVRTASWIYYIETYFAANAAYLGMADEGVATMRKIASVIEADGSPWSAPLVWGGAENREAQWGAFYMTNPSCWHFMLAVAGVNYSVPTAELTLHPNVPSDWGGLQQVPVFMPKFWASVSTGPRTIKLRVDALFDLPALPVDRLRTRKDISVTKVNGREVATSSVPSSQPDSNTFELRLELKPGDVIELSWPEG